MGGVKTLMLGLDPRIRLRAFRWNSISALKNCGATPSSTMTKVLLFVPVNREAQNRVAGGRLKGRCPRPSICGKARLANEKSAFSAYE